MARRETDPEELDEPPHHAVGAEHLGQRQDEVAVVPAGSCPSPYRPRRAVGGTWTEHRRLGFDAADAPSQDPGPDQTIVVWESVPINVSGKATLPDADLTEMLQVHLMADAGAGRTTRESVEGLLGPAEQRVALTVAPVLPIDVGLVRVLGAEEVHLDRVVDDQVDRHERIDAGGTPPARATAPRIAARSTTAGTP